jgi:dethiobiotin synthetase
MRIVCVSLLEKSFKLILIEGVGTLRAPVTHAQRITNLHYEFERSLGYKCQVHLI